MKKSCEFCNEVFDRRPNAKYCSDLCQYRASNQRKSERGRAEESKTYYQKNRDRILTKARQKRINATIDKYEREGKRYLIIEEKVEVF